MLHPLLRVHSDITYQNSTGQGPEEGDLFVAAEGYTQGVVTNPNHIAQRWLSQPSTGQASPSQLAGLRSALDVNQVGLQQGPCVLTPFPLDFGTAELTWYGSKGFRRNDLTVYLIDAPPGTPSCSPAVCQILLAIGIYADAVLKPSPFKGFDCPTPP
ncbi:MAG TPA: hypothetical protein VJA16_03265 [Thermoanaerobaculia bacterium]